jgi:hypothetical protein
MNTHKGSVVIRRLNEARYAVSVDGIVRDVGSQEECEATRRNPGSEG